MMMNQTYRIPRILWVGLGLYIIVFVTLSVLQYFRFGYSGQDLAIFDQVLWNTAHGNWFWYSFADYSYLVDHREWLLAPLAALYWIIPHPITILVLQTIVIASGAIPLYFIARHVLCNVPAAWSLGLSLFYLLNPALHYMNLYEFHMYPFVIPLTFWWWWSVEKGKIYRAVIIFLLILLVRDDTAIMTAGAGLLLLLFPRFAFPKKPQRWMGAGVIMVSVAWLLMMEKIGMALSPYEVPKYFVYFDWAGQTTLDVIYTIIAQPVATLQTMVSEDHVITIVMVFASVGFLALFGIRYLIPLVGVLLLYLLTDTNIASALLTQHHAAPFIPWLFIASCYGLRRLLDIMHRRAQRPSAFPLDAFAVASIAAIFLFQTFYVGPWRIAREILSTQNNVDVQEMRQVLQKVSPHARVLATARFYPYLSHRQYIYPLQHLWFGKEHLMNTDYKPPTDIEWMLIEQDEVLGYVSVLSWESIEGIPDRLTHVIDDNQLQLTHAGESVFVYQRANGNAQVESPIRKTEHALAQTLRVPVSATVELQGWEKDDATLRLQFQRVREKEHEEKELHYQLTWYDEYGKKIKMRRFLIGAALSPTTAWTVGEPQPITQHLVTPSRATRLELTVGNVVLYSDSDVIKIFKTMMDPRQSVSVTLTTQLQ